MRFFSSHKMGDMQGDSQCPMMNKETKEKEVPLAQRTQSKKLAVSAESHYVLLIGSSIDMS